MYNLRVRLWREYTFVRVLSDLSGKAIHFVRRCVLEHSHTIECHYRMFASLLVETCGIMLGILLEKATEVVFTRVPEKNVFVNAILICFSITCSWSCLVRDAVVLTNILLLLSHYLLV